MQYEWTDAMATGVESLDDEHRTLISWINRLSDANDASTGPDELRRVLAFLEVYSARHFAHEEGCFARHRCTHAEANERAHRVFSAKIAQCRAECDAHGITQRRAIELQQMLGDWLRDHILGVDTNLRPCMKA